MARSARQLKILELISKRDIETQDELAQELLLGGFNVTQATISRDIKEVGLIKISTPDGRQKYAKEVTDHSVSAKITNLFKAAVTSIDYAQNLVIIKTLSGSANTAGLMIDKLSSANILGCVAGDDTVMVVTKSEQAAIEVVNSLNDIISEE